MINFKDLFQIVNSYKTEYPRVQNLSTAELAHLTETVRNVKIQNKIAASYLSGGFRCSASKGYHNDNRTGILILL
jgi:hypothetical protein